MTDQVKEAQLKLGYAKETVRLYYPVDSLNTILGSNAKDDQEMLTLLRKAFEEKSSLRTSFSQSCGPCGDQHSAGRFPVGA